MNIDAIAFQTTAVPDAGAGQLYDTVIYFATSGNAAMPDTFNVLEGELPRGMSLIADREDTDGDGQPDPDGKLTGNARLVGFPRVERTGLPYTFVVKAISTGQLATSPQPPGAPALAAEQPFQIEVFEGRLNILNPTAEQGSNDPAVPAFPDVISFVNPENPQAFFSFPFETAGGSGNNSLVVYLPRELELSVFDRLATSLEDDTDESAETNDKFKVHFSDGGVFNLQAGDKKVQIGGFQSPRGELGKINPLDPDWFQRSLVDNGPPVNSRRSLNDEEGIGIFDNTLGTEKPIAFSDYFNARYEGTHDGFTAPDTQPDLKRRKYPFVASEYTNAFLQRYDPAIHQTPLRYNAIVEAIDTRGTADKSDDIIARKAYVVQVKIPDIVIDSVFIDGGTAGLDYNVFVGASGGVPPLQFELEWVDSTDDAMVTEGTPLSKDIFGVDLDIDKGGFFGRPRASGIVDLSVRVFAEVMNPSQDPPVAGTYVPTGGVDIQGRENEWNGFHPVTGEPGIHKTFRVEMLPPSLPAILNSALDPAVDGNSYRAADGSGNVIIRGIGGVPQLVPNPVGFGPNYPANPTVSYELAVTYDQDTSYSPPMMGVDGLPNALSLDGDINSATNGEITGVALDRGFHPVHIIQRDRFVGDAASADVVAGIQEVTTTLALSVSPDTALYLRGLQTSEGTGGVPSGLTDQSAQIAESRMVPMFTASPLFRATTGSSDIEKLKGLPPKADMLPIGIVNGGSRGHVDKSEPSISGFFPGEAGKENDWWYSGNRAWRANQQEFSWVQIPNEEQTRVFMWGETRIRNWNNGSNGLGMYGKRYQAYDVLGQRGILVVEPRTGNFWVPASFSNTPDDDDGAWFGSEFVQSPTGVGYYQPKTPYRSFYYYSTRDYADADHHGQGGLGSYLENLSTSSASSQGWYAYDFGRGGVSVAVSDDGLWCATAMPGGNQQKIAIWRTDGKPIDEDSDIFASSTVAAVDGVDADGNTMTNSAGIIEVGGGASTANDILPDSLKFVEGGLIFMRFTETTSTSSYSMNKIFGFSLKNGALTNLDIQAARENIGSIPSGPSLYFDRRQVRYVPDQDQIRGVATSQTCLSQWAWAGNKAAEGEAGPNAIAFTAGQLYDVERNSWTGSTDREGFRVEGNRNMSLFFMNFDGTGADGLDLGTATVTDMTGNDSDIYGDLLTPGRPGEMLDFLKVSGDGKYIALVRDHSTFDSTSFGFYNRRPTFSHYYGGTSRENGMPSHDVLLFSTPVQHADDSLRGGDLDSGKTGMQHVLFVGTNNNTSDTNTAPSGSLPTYAGGNSLINSQWRRIHGLDFSEDNTKLFFEYVGHQSYNTLNMGYLYGWVLNPTGQSGSYYYNVGTAMIAQFNFRSETDDYVRFTGGTVSALIKNPLDDLDTKITGAVGTKTGGRFGPTNPQSIQNFWARFRSPNGKFLYYVCDTTTAGVSHMFGINMTSEDIVSPQGKTREPYMAFSVHGQGIKFEQFEANGFNYESRFAAVPGGTVFGTGPDARDGGGIVFVIAGDSTATSAPETDLEVYALDADQGGDLMVLTSDVTDDGTVNAINNLYVSMDGNTLIGQRATATSSRDSRVPLTSQTDLFAVTNVHDALRGATPRAIVISENGSHGASVALVGEGTPAGAQAIIYSHASGNGNATWDDRQLFVSVVAPNANRTALDQTKSHYNVIAGSRKLDDDPTLGASDE